MRNKLFGRSALAAAVLVAACGEQPTSAPAVSPLIGAPALAVSGGPNLNDPLSFQGELWICKDGNGPSTVFNFNWSIVSKGVPFSSGSVAVPLGQCVKATTVPLDVSSGYRATITELAPPAGWSLTSVTTDYGVGRMPRTPTVDLATRTASAIALSNDLGVQVTFTNTYNPAIGEIGDFVWYDVNGNGVQDASEPGLAGVTVTLGGAASATTTTDANGQYLFSSLAAGTYTVTVATPAGYVASPSNQGGDPTKDSNGSPATVTLATNSSTDYSIDFGYTKGLGTIGDFVWNDQNGNGVQDAGEPGIPGVTVTLAGAANASTTTDASGKYLFQNLPAGSYVVTVNTPAGYSDSPSNQGGDPTMDSNGSPASVTLATNISNDLSIDFGFVENRAGQIGDFVWYDVNGDGIQDPGEPGIAGVQVTLGGAATGTTTTNASGAYLFTGLSAGTYTVTVTPPPSYSPSPSNQGGDPTKDSNGSPATVVLATNTSSDLTVDFGYTLGVGSIGDLVWYDVNGNGVQDPSEPGIAGVTVLLNNGVSGTTTTSGTGAYLFTGLDAGTYTVTVQAPPGYVATTSNQGGDPAKDSNGSPATVTLATNTSSDLTIDFGYTKPLGTIGDFVWNDLNGNGVQDAGEPGMAGLTVTLGGKASATTTTDQNGKYLFSGLYAGNYTVTVATPAGFNPSPSNQGGNPILDSNGSPASVTLASNISNDLSIDFGFVEIKAGQIGDFVWNDLNGNGVQDAGEPGIPGLTVTLSGPVNATTTTNGSGGYLFTGLPAGTYTVTVGTPSGFSVSPSNQGGDPSKDSNGSPATVVLATNTSTDLTIDFGFTEIPAGKIGDFVWNDLNGNGIQDAGEPGISGVIVDLGGAATATTTTDANGFYQFTGLKAGSYTVTLLSTPGLAPTTSNQGGDPNKDSNGSPANVTLATNSSVDQSIDFGFVACQRCNGGVTSLTLKNNGPGTVILVKQGSTVIFNAFVPSGGTFAVAGRRSDGTFGKEIQVTANGVTTKIKTDCNVDIGPGAVFGNFEVVNGTSRLGGVLCPTNGGALSPCDGGRPKTLTWRYVGGDCSIISDPQSGKALCTGDSKSTSPVYITVTDGGSKNMFSGIVVLNEPFIQDASTVGMPSNSVISVYESNGGPLLQKMTVHTSCSQPLEFGYRFGSVVLMEATH